MSDSAATNLPEFSVSELSQAVKRTVEGSFPYVRVRGEVSGFRGRHSSGHCYFGLKDEAARIDAVVWKGTWTRLKCPPEEGLEVIATGRVTTYPGRSTYQLVVESLEPAGIGALMALLEERRKKLAAEGLFEAARKRPIPYLPRVIGVVTSPTGSVIRDILHRLADRFPTRVVVWPVRVQGDGAAGELTAAIKGFNAGLPDGPVPRPDVIIVARGGGSIEDLWPFNEEEVVRAAAESAIPLISAVGHETDTTLIDHAADIRAPTPSAAAEMAVPVRAELVAGCADRARRLVSALMRLLQERRGTLRAATRGLPRLADLLALPRQRLDESSGRLPRALLANARAHRTAFVAIASRLTGRQLQRRVGQERERATAMSARADRAQAVIFRNQNERLGRLARLIEVLGHKSVLKRGFALVKDGSGALVRSSRGHSPGAALQLTFADGELEVAVGGGRAAPSPRLSRPSIRQPSLFEE